MQTGFPAPREDDADDVLWQLTTGATLWNAGEVSDALAWLRRATSAALDAGHRARATELAWVAGEIAAALERARPAAPQPAAPTVIPRPPSIEPPAGIVHASPRPAAAPAPAPAPLPAPTPPPLTMRAPSQPVRAPDFDTEASEPDPISVHNSAEVNWLEVADPRAAAALAQRDLPSDPFGAAPAPVGRPTVVPSGEPMRIALAFEDDEPPTESPLPAFPLDDAPPFDAHAEPLSGGFADAPGALELATDAGDELVVVGPVSDGAMPVAAAVPLEVAPETAASPDDAAPVDERARLLAMACFSDLPHEVRADLAARARIETLVADEELPIDGLVYVLEGSAAVELAVADAVATRVRAGDFVHARGTLGDRMKLRLVASEDTAKVASWPEAIVAQKLAKCPWVLDELCAEGDRLQALAGATLGPLGERLDETLRGIALEHLAVRALGPGEAIVHEGQPVPGVAVVGVGTVVLESAGTRRGEVGAGGIVLADEVLGGAPASASAKAGPDGAVVLFGERKQVHELLVSCPPLLEIFAGM